MNYQEPNSPRLSHDADATRERFVPSRERRVIIITAVIVAIVLGVLWGFNTWRSHMMKSFFANNKPPPSAVSVETVQAGSLPQSLTAIGSVAAVHQVMISPEVAGRVTKFSFLPGTEVKKGDLLVQINDAPEQADLASARAQERLTKLTLDRAHQLVERGFESRANVDQAQSQYDAAVATIARDEALIEQKHIRAPFDGVLGVRQVEVGQYVNTGAPLVMLTDISFLYVDFTVPEQARPQLNLGQDLNITVDAYPGRTFQGKLYVLDPQITPDTRTIHLQAIMDNHDRLLMPGMFAHVELTLPSRENVITVNQTALDHNVYGDFVYVVHPGEPGPDGKPQLKVTRLAVTASERTVDRVAVTGLKPGDQVVTAGQVKLFDGATVTINPEPVLVKPSQIPLN